MKSKLIYTPYYRALTLDNVEFILQIGNLAFISMLLVMGGIEENPGPADHFNFRYQFLLIELGTDLLRKTFDEQIGMTIDQYLVTYPQYINKIQVLVNKGVITKTQKALLPPVSMTPLTSNFDVTLLSCLLRNICGLKKASDEVWTNPDPNDLSLEADIARLRLCRNKLGHSGTVRIPKAQLDANWKELCQILVSLNSKLKNGVVNLQSEIAKAEIMEIDENLKKNHEETLTFWEERDKALDHGLAEISGSLQRIEQKQNLISDRMVQGIEQLSEGIGSVKKTIKAFEAKILSNSPQGPQVDKLDAAARELRKDLVYVYKKDCSMLPVSPVIVEEEIDLFSIYSDPSFVRLQHYKIQNEAEKCSISSYEEIFMKDGKDCVNVYVTADAGMGKTSLCQRMCLLWSEAHSDEINESEKMKNDINFLRCFEYVFYVSLREFNCTSVVALIEHQLKDVDESLIKHVLKVNKCLILLDGLDEWTVNDSSCSVPIRPLSDTKCVYLTTSRPYKLESIRLRSRDIDHLVEITGIHGNAAKHYVKCMVEYLNEKYNDKKKPYDFHCALRTCGLQDQTSVPVLCSQLIFLWFDGKLTQMSNSFVYAYTLEMLFKHAVVKDVKIPTMHCADYEFPPFYSSLDNTRKHSHMLHKICRVAFDSLKKRDKTVSHHVFTTEQLRSKPYFLSSDESDYLCKVGILSKNKVIGRLLEDRKMKLSFIHKSFCEFLAALYICSFDKQNHIDLVVQGWTKLKDFLQFDNFYVLLSGLSFEKVNYIFQKLYLNLRDELGLCRKMAVHDIHDVFYNEQSLLLQNITLKCIKEGRTSTKHNVVLRLENYVIGNNTDYSLIKELLVKHKDCVKSIHTMNGDYLDEFSYVENLVSLILEDVSSSSMECFIGCMLRSKCSLKTLGFSSCEYVTLPVSDLAALTSISLCSVRMKHSDFQQFINCLSDKTKTENIKLHTVRCADHNPLYETDCEFLLKLSNKTKLDTLVLFNVDVYCQKLNGSQMQHMTLKSCPRRLSIHFGELYTSIQYSQLRYLSISYVFDDNDANLLTAAVKSLRHLKHLRLHDVNLYDYLLKIHAYVEDLKVIVYEVTLSIDSFYALLHSIAENGIVANIELGKIIIILGEGRVEMAECVNYISKYISSFELFTITYQHDVLIHFETQCKQ